MSRAVLLVAGVVLIAGGIFTAALRRAASGPPDAGLREQVLALARRNAKLQEENARLAREIERLRAAPPAASHQRIHEAVLPLLGRGREDLAEPALRLLADVDPLDRACAEALLEALRSGGSRRVRVLAAQALSMRRDRFPDLDHAAVADGLVDAARLDRETEVRLAALASLGGCDPPQEDLDALFDIAAGDAREEVRAAAARALAGARPAARGPFLARIERVFETERSSSVRTELARAAASVGGESAGATLDRLKRIAPDLFRSQ